MKKHTRLYKCPKCTNVAVFDTFDTQDFTAQCRRCHCVGPQRCLEFEAVEAAVARREQFPLIRTRIHFLSTEEDVVKASVEYKMSPVRRGLQSAYFESHPPVTNGEIWLETEKLFKNTWSVAFDSPTHSLMQLDTFCAVYKDFGRTFCYGYLIEPTIEMRERKQSTPYCGQCGQSAEPDALFCAPCLNATPFTFKRCQTAKLLRQGEQQPLTQSEYISATLMILKNRITESSHYAHLPSLKAVTLRGQHQHLISRLKSYLDDGNSPWLTPSFILIEEMQKNLLFLSLVRKQIEEIEAGQDLSLPASGRIALN